MVLLDTNFLHLLIGGPVLSWAAEWVPSRVSGHPEASCICPAPTHENVSGEGLDVPQKQEPHFSFRTPHALFPVVALPGMLYPVN